MARRRAHRDGCCDCRVPQGPPDQATGEALIWRLRRILSTSWPVGSEMNPGAVSAPKPDALHKKHLKLKFKFMQQEAGQAESINSHNTRESLASAEPTVSRPSSTRRRAGRTRAVLPICQRQRAPLSNSSIRRAARRVPACKIARPCTHKPYSKC